MALSYSTDRVDENGKELLSYGSFQFPIAFFDDDLTIVSVPYHWHDEFEFVIITEGCVHVRIAGKEFSLRAGEGYFSNRGVLHAASLQTPTGHQHALVFSPDVIAREQELAWTEYVEPILQNHSLPFVRLTSSIPWQKEILRLADLAWDYGAYDKKDYLLQVRFCLGMAFSLLCDHAAEMEVEFRDSEKYRRDELRIKKALSYIEQNYDSGITIESIADSANISVSSCLRLFQRVLGTTPIRYLMKTRIQKAAEALKRMDAKSISEIAYECGFSDASYFNRCFRKEYGKTPSEYVGKRQSGQTET